MENEQQSFIDQNYDIEISQLKEVVQKYAQREKGYEELDYLEEIGGEKKLKNGLDTDFGNGIVSSTVPNRERFFGTNRKEKVKIKTFWQLFWGAIMDDLILKILIVAGIASIIINVAMEEEERTTAWVEGFAILLAVAIVAGVTAWNDLKQEKEFQNINEKAESGKKITLVRDGISNDEMIMQDVQAGDLMMIKGGQEMPGDGIIIEANQIKIDESSMTGETKAMEKNTLEICQEIKKRELESGEEIKHHTIPSNVILAGTIVLTGTGKIIIINVGKHSAIGKIQELIATEEEMTPLQLKLEKIARDISIFGLVSAVAIFVVLTIILIVEESLDGWPEEGLEYANLILEYFLIAIAILVVAIPEGLPLAVTLSLAFSVDKMQKEQNLVRKMQACETMGGANIICSDKTGTLTRNEMFWIQFWNKEIIDIFKPETNEAVPFSTFTNDKTKEIFQNTILLNSDDNPDSKNGNPTELALLKYFKFQDFDVVGYRDGFKDKVFDVPFNSDRKRMSKIFRLPNGEEYVFMKGASEYMLEACSQIHLLKDDKIIPLNEDLKKQGEQAIITMATKSLRTIGLCYKNVDSKQLDLKNEDEKGIYSFEKNGFTLVGIAGIKDIIRTGVTESIRICHKASIDVKMVTGDNKITARAIAEEINIISPEERETALVMEGPEFLKLVGGVHCENCMEKSACDCVVNEYQLSKPENKGKKVRKDVIKNPEEFAKIWKNLKVLARSRPEDKYALVCGLKECDNVVAVTGDGTNDAPALKKADVGFAMGIAGTEVAKQAADIMIMDDSFASIVTAVKWGRNIYDSIRKFIQLQLTANVVAVITTFVSAIILKEAIFSAVQMLWFNLIIDSLAALALATEPPHDDLLKRKPYKRTEYIISPLMMKHILGQAVFQSAIIFIIVFAGEFFLFDVIGQRQIRTGNLIVNGRVVDGYDRDDYNGQYSVHFTYVFNVFVMMQFFNFFNCRILDDSFNIFKRITKSYYFIYIMVIIFVLQIIFLTFVGKAIRVVMWGLDPISWLFCIGIGILVWIWSFILKLIPLERILPGGGKEELKKEDLDKYNALGVKKSHTS